PRGGVGVSDDDHLDAVFSYPTDLPTAGGGDSAGEGTSHHNRNHSPRVWALHHPDPPHPPRPRSAAHPSDDPPARTASAPRLRNARANPQPPTASRSLTRLAPAALATSTGLRKMGLVPLQVLIVG